MVCPACAFTFDAIHTDEGGGYSCPACAEDAQRTARQRAEKDFASAEAYATGLSAALDRETAALRSKLEAAEREREEQAMLVGRALDARDIYRDKYREALAVAEEAVRFLWGVDECDIIAARQKATDLTARLATVKGDQDG